MSVSFSDPKVSQRAASMFAKVAPLSVVTIVAALGTSLVNVILPEISAEFGVGMSTAQWSTLAFLLASTVLIVPAGWLGDTIGRTRVLMIAITVFGVGSLLAGLAPTMTVVVIARAVQGIGAAAMLALPIALVRQTVAPEHMGRAMGVIGSSMATGMALGPAVGGIIASSPLGWRGSFGIFLLLSVVALILVWRGIPRVVQPGNSGRSLDVPGLLLLAFALLAYSVALTLRLGGTPGIVALLIVAGLALWGFVVRQIRGTSPLVDLVELGKMQVFPQLGMTFGGALIMMTFTIVPPFYLTMGLGLDIGWMGLVMAVGPAAAILSGVPAGRMVDKLGAPRMTILGLGLMTTAALGFIVLPVAIGLAGFLISAVILTPGNQMFMAANNTSVMSKAPADQQGAISGVLNLTRNLGFITGTAVMAALFDMMTAHTVTPVEQTAGATAGLQVTFAVAAVVGLTSIGLAWYSFIRNRKS